jgi:hypothetical protein
MQHRKEGLKKRISKILLRTQRLLIISCRHYNKSEVKKYETKAVDADTKSAVHTVPLHGPCNLREYRAAHELAERTSYTVILHLDLLKDGAEKQQNY